MLWIFEAQFMRDFSQVTVNIQHPFFGYVNDFGLDILLRGLTGFFFDQVAEIIGGEIQLKQHTNSLRQAVRLLQQGRSEIIIQQDFEFFKNPLIRIFAGDELPVIKHGCSNSNSVLQ